MIFFQIFTRQGIENLIIFVKKIANLSNIFINNILRKERRPSLCFKIKNFSTNRFCPLQRVRDVLETSKCHFRGLCFRMKNCSRNRFCPLQRVRDVLETSKYHFWVFCFTIKNVSGLLCLLHNAFETSYSLLHSHFGSLDALISLMTNIMFNLEHKFNLSDYSFFDCISSNFCKLGLQEFLL